MDWVKTLQDETDTIFTTNWDERDGYVIPTSESVALKDGAVKVDATFLYADLAGSSKLAKVCPWETTAKIIRSYLACSTRLIRAYNGEIRSFDGDRVMGVFMGDMKNTHAVRCAREIFWVVEKIIGPKATQHFKSIKNNSINIRHCVGVDTGTARAVRAGIRNNNDLIWIGRAPSLAAKLSDIREYPYSVYITNDCYSKMNEGEKTCSDGTALWERRTVKIADDDLTVYCTKYLREP